MPDPIDQPSEEPGDGPGKGNVPLPAIVIGSIYLVLMISGLIWGLARYWPHCEVQCAPEVVSVTSTPANTGTPTNSNTNSNAAASSRPTPVRATPTAASATPKENPTD